MLNRVSAPDGEVVTWSRDAEQRVRTIAHNDKDGASTESFTYDANDDVTSDVVTRGGDVGKSSSYAYDALGRVYQVKGAHGQMLMTYAYDGDGNVLSAADALGRKSSYAYDALGRLIGATNAAGGVTSYVYDSADHVIGVEDPRGLVTSYAWDGLGLLWQQQSPDSGTTSYAYDAYGRQASKTWADGSQLVYAYDAMNRLVSATGSGTTRAYLWDACTNGKGRLCAATVESSDDSPVPPAIAPQAIACPCATPVDSVGYSYTPEGWITGRAFTFNDGASYSLGFAYDNMGHLSVVDYPDGNQAIYDYTDGAVADVRLKVGSYNVYGVTNIGYRPMDLAMSTWTSFNGLNNTIAYDSDLRPTSITVPGVESLAFAYDAANRITDITNGGSASLSQTLGYDAVSRLTSVTLGNGGGTASYAYDADGNRVSQTSTSGVVTNFAYASTSNRLASVSGGMTATYGYNADGDTKTIDGHMAYTYGPFNALVNASGTAFAISAEGQRLEKSSAAGTTYFAPDASGPLLAEDLNGTWRDYVWLNGRLVEVVANGGVFSLHDDQTGRPLYLTDPNSHAVDWAAEGLPFDRDTIANRWGAFEIGFPGQYWDTEDNLWHNGNRDYDPTLGRYIESDPIGLAGGVNTYAYVVDNPVSNVDPLGLCPTCTQLQQQAAQVAAAFNKVSEQTGAVALGGTLVTGIAAFFEPETFGADTPATIASAEATGYAGAVSVIAAAAGADLNSFAGGNLRAMGRFDFASIAEIAMKLTASKLPIISDFSDALGQLSGKAVEISVEIPAACASQ